MSSPNDLIPASPDHLDDGPGQGGSRKEKLKARKKRNKKLAVWATAGTLGVGVIAGAYVAGSQSGSDNNPDTGREPDVEGPVVPGPVEGNADTEPETGEGTGGYDEAYDYGEDTFGITPDTPFTRIPSLETLAFMENPGTSPDESFVMTPEEAAERFGLTLDQAQVAVARSNDANPHTFEDVVEKSVGESVSIETLMSESYQRELKEKLLVDTDRNMDAKQIAENLTDMIRLGILIGGYDYDEEAREKQIRLDSQTRERYAFFPEPGPPPGGGTVINTSNWLLPGMPHTFFAPGPGYGIDGLKLLSESRERAILTDEHPEMEEFQADHVAFDLVGADWDNVELHFTESGVEKTVPFVPGMLSDPRYFGSGGANPLIKIPDTTIVYGTHRGDSSELLSDIRNNTTGYTPSSNYREVFNGDLFIAVTPEDGVQRDEGDVRYSWASTHLYN